MTEGYQMFDKLNAFPSPGLYFRDIESPRAWEIGLGNSGAWDCCGSRANIPSAHSNQCANHLAQQGKGLCC